MDRDIRGSAGSDRIWRSGDVLILLVFFEGLRRVGFDRLVESVFCSRYYIWLKDLRFVFVGSHWARKAIQVSCLVIQILVLDTYMRILHLFDHILVDIFNDNLPSSSRIGDLLLGALDSSFGGFMRNRISAGLLCSLSLSSGLLVQLSIAFTFVLIQILEEFLHGRDRVGTRVMATGGMLLLLLHVAVSPPPLVAVTAQDNP